MRWHEQIASTERAGSLPGFPTAVARTFDAPEALKARFHEIRAKSALNRVPNASKLPFGWTVNPYRGCLHACTFCTWSHAKVLLADGGTRRMADLRPGDAIYGTTFDGGYRRYHRTIVRDHWSSIKPAYKTTLADGTELVTSGDHRVLTQGHGWRHVVGAMGGRDPRPYLTTTSRLVGTGRFAAGPTENVEYQRGYLAGVIPGDGLALVDEEALVRTELYLASSTTGVHQRVLAVVTDRRRSPTATSTSERPSGEPITALTRIPVTPSDDWRKGFLAGSFDAGGSCTAGSSALRIYNRDDGIIAWTHRALRHFGFDAVVEDPERSDGPRVVRLRGGPKEHLRFFHLTDPAITRKRDVEGCALESDADLRVVSIEPLGKAMRLYDITTGTGDYIADGVVHHNCFARPTHEYLDFDAGKDFDEQIVVKVNAPEVLRAELRRPSWRGEHVALGTNTDPYQWVEKRYRLTRGILEVLRDARNPCSVLTKSPLLLRDLELFLELMEVTEFSACLSIPTLDERAWRATEPHTPHPRKRLEAVAQLNAAGIPTGVLVAPLMPGINDAPEQVEDVVAECEAAGAVRIGGQALFLRGATKDVFMGWLRQGRPDLVPLYERLYGRGAYLPRAQKEATEARLKELTRARRRPDLAARLQRGAALEAARHGAVLEAPARREMPGVQEKLF